MLRQLFRPSSRSVSDDQAGLEEYLRNSFALVPSALTPSCTPSNSVIAVSRALFCNMPVRLGFTSGLENGPVRDWYNKQKVKGSTAIKKIQLRKDHEKPYYHEYITISTRSGHTYRVDRRPDPDAPIDTIMKIGCIAYDMIEELDSTSFKELDSTSSCVVELHWQGKDTIDLLFVLSICFAIHNDELANRYTLQRYNCYFLSWAIIGIAMRKSAVRGAVFKPSRLDWEPALEREELVRVRVRVRELQRALEEVRARKLQQEREGVVMRVQMMERELELERKRERELERARKRERELEQVWERERALGLEQAQEWAHGLGQIPLVLGPMKNFALAETVPSSLRESHMIVIRCMMKDETEDQYQTALNLANFPASFSVSLNDHLGSVKSKTPHANISRPAELERHIVKVIEKHATRVAHWGLGSSAGVKSDILAGIWRTWQTVSELSMHVS
ncbi:hypothetical protein PILCRDRAFT_825113 [Piloderma croceum F 1598]|uniref:Uncharacterized protein n=1 Tax=Piloderma croceum (strain F 1598) TaxID=765440 RepID=A0A0C3FCX3_PILCF|nr:hypothetical protein PILCRDRAFT_825113 [Piloderma croceum F 1598]